MEYADKQWRFQYKRGMSARPFKSGKGFWFHFPGPTGAVSYVVCAIDEVLDRRQRTVIMTCRIETSDDYEFDEDTMGDDPGTMPPSVRVMLFEDINRPVGGRWWALQGIELRPGTHSITVPIAPFWWGNEIGQRGDTEPDMFRATLRRPLQMAITFGGGNDYGHGVRMARGSATFRLLRLTVR